MKYMEEIGEDTQEDVVRAFFCSRVADVGKLLSKVSDIIVAGSKSPTGNVYSLLPEANSVVVVSSYLQNISILILIIQFRRS
jgi:nuclear pore complex protein Nup133